MTTARMPSPRDPRRQPQDIHRTDQTIAANGGDGDTSDDGTYVTDIDLPDALDPDILTDTTQDTTSDTIPGLTSTDDTNSEDGSEQDDDPDGTVRDEEDEPEDAESYADEAPVQGPPVDPTEGVPPRLLSRRGTPVKPIVPTWARSRSDIYLTARWAVKYAGYVAAYHLSRTPKYAAKVAVWAPVGAFRTVGRLIHWATAEEGNWALRQRAADRGDAELWLRLDRQRQRESTWRWWVTGPTLLAMLVGLLVLVFGPIPTLWEVATWSTLAVVAARLGRPADKPITDRVTQGKTYRKLTAELVRRGLTSLGLSGINSAVAKDPGAICFPSEIHRDGPGHLALVDLPYGVEAAEVVARRGRLASALRLPVDQVWPERDPAHPGRLALWVGYEPASAMVSPLWPLLKDGKVDVFKTFPFATDPRLRALHASLMFRNWLFGGQPGSGKTFALRLLVLAAALDPRVELRGYELKGVGDFKVISPVCTEYGNGFDEDTIAACAAMFDWLHAECERRSKRIDFYAAKGMCPKNKATPELASLKGSGLHPLVVFVDEVQELFQHPKHGKHAGEMAEKVIKMGRALGVIILLGTQIPDKDSLPTGVTRNVNTRFCLSVADQTANDMILGTSMYKNGHRATVFEPEIDAGWGIAVGLGKPGSYRSYNIDNDQTPKIIARAVRYRQARGTMPTAPEVRDTRPTYDLLADLNVVWPGGEDAAWNEVLCGLLTDLRPETYGGWEPIQLTTALKPFGIEAGQILRRIDGKAMNRRGIRRPDLDAAITKRNETRSSD